MYKYLQFDIRAVDNLKLGKFERDANNEYTHSYIPGSVIKGAIVWNLVHKNGNVPKAVLNGDTIFYNAYPLISETSTVPMMQGYVGNKQEIRSNRDEVQIKHSFNNKVEENVIPYSNYEFITYDKNSCSVQGYNPKKIENLHINKKDAENLDSDSKMFRYESIQKGECFRGYIRINEDYVKDISEVLKEVVYFGGSRGSGYGKCEISNLEAVSDVQLYDSDLEIKDNLYIYFLSDAILYYNGRVNTYIPQEVLKESLGIEGECKYLKSYSNLTTAAAFNTMYNTNTVCYSAVSKGSVIKYSVEEKIEPIKIKELIEKGVGIRKEDGYGQIAILNKIQDNLVVSEYRREECIIEGNIELKNEEKVVLKNILKNIFKERAKLRVERLVIDMLSNVKSKSSLQAQIGKLLNIFKNGVYKTDRTFKGELKEYLDHMAEKKGKDIWHKLNRFSFSCDNAEHSVEKISVQRILVDFVDNKPNSVFSILDNISEQGVNIGEYKYPEEENKGEVFYNLQMDFFTSLFEYCIRMKEVRQ